MSSATGGDQPTDQGTAHRDVMSDTHQNRGRAIAGRLFVVAGLCGLAVAQPTLDLLGASPATFQVNRIEGSSIFLFAAAVVLVPPLVLWTIGEIGVAVHRQAGRVVHLATVAALLAMLGILFTKEITGNAAINGLGGVVVAAAGSYAYTRFDAMKSWLRFLSIANILLLVQFAYVAPVSDSIDEAIQPAIELEVEFDEPPPSVLMLVFDEWPTQSILADDGTIDEVRFPNLSAFAQESTWYRRFNTVSPFTQSAVPVLLDGLDPYGEATWNDHPDSLFSLLAESHHLIVSESVTRLCGLKACGVDPPPPAAEVEVDVELAAEVPETPPTAPKIDDDPRWRQLFDTAWGIWTDRVTPGATAATPNFDDFEEELVSISPVVDPAPAPEVEPDPPTSEPEPELAPEADEETIRLARFFATLLEAQPNRHQVFVDALRPTDEPFFGFLHLVLPHQPWTIRETGAVYGVSADRRDFDDKSDPWPVSVTRQRHLLQAEFADRLLGDVIGHLKEIGEYDDTLIVVVSDHGVAFEVDGSTRKVTDTNLEQIAYSPLLIKAPGQINGEVSDANVNATDVAPTVAAMLGLDLPWPTDGAVIGSAALDERGNDKYIYMFTDDFDYTFLGIRDFDDDEMFGEVLDGLYPSIATGEDRLAGLYRNISGSELIGQSAEVVFGPVDGDATVVDLDRLLAPESDAPLLGEVAGRVASAEPGSTVVVAVNDIIVGVSPLYERFGENNSFVVLLPGNVLGPIANVITLGLRHPDGTIVALDLGK